MSPRNVVRALRPIVQPHSPLIGPGLPFVSPAGGERLTPSSMIMVNGFLTQIGGNKTRRSNAAPSVRPPPRKAC